MAEEVMKIDEINYDEKGLVPVVVQDAENGQVLMLAYANKDAIERTQAKHKTHFWSRSRNKIWEKGEESGNTQDVKEIFVDCDRDAILVLVDQKGVSCHTGQRTCFFTKLGQNNESAPTFGTMKGGRTLDEVYQVVDDRKRNPKEGSYVSTLFKDGIDTILKKIGEEAAEAVIAAKNENNDEIIYEVADLWFHSLVLLANFGIAPQDIYEEFGRRFGRKKDEYKK
jgi:phosphoribosyl-ATP pyrophosphohydrolase/phosphoribosyl-AMP cyclohydrolase